ncbi:hypothetical protein FQA39_LY18600 [Lamprigera yunnana]|nr:hypothetical protein FQA39_LY18600 [Lamprigera yunnana]
MEKVLQQMDKKAVENFRKYLRIPSVHPNVNYDDCVTFLREQAADLNLLFNVYETCPKKPMVILTWIGKEPTLSSIMLNSHMDVVPVFEEKWIYKPFNADIDEEGNIYARGAQDVKSLGIQYLEAIRRLKQDGFVPRRTLHVSFAPEEELGGVEGMKVFVKTDYFRKMNVGFALDEGIPGETEYWIYYGEKVKKNIVIYCPGTTGHASQLLADTAGEKLTNILKKFYEFRMEEKIKSEQASSTDDIITVNLTMIEGGIQNNVIPSQFTITFDARLPPTHDVKGFKNKIELWCKEAGNGVCMEDFDTTETTPITILSNNPFWAAFENTVKKMNIALKTKILDASSDAKYLRQVGVPTLGFCPHLHTPNRAHQHNEYMNINIFLHGIDSFCKIIPALSNVPQ